MKKTFFLVVLNLIFFELKAQKKMIDSINLNTITSINLEGTFNEVEVLNSNENILIITYNEIIKERVSQSNNGTELKIKIETPSTKIRNNKKIKEIYNTQASVKILVKPNKLNDFLFSKVNTIVFKSFQQNDLNMELNVCGTLKGKINVVLLNLTVNSSELKFKGEGERLNLKSHSSNVSLSSLNYGYINLESKSSNITLSAKEKLKIDSAIDSNIYYKGDGELLLNPKGEINRLQINRI